MGNYAVVKDNYVENLIAIEEAQIPEMEEALQCELVDAAPFRLAIGDLRVNGNWTRNEDGVQTILTERPLYSELESKLATTKEEYDALMAVIQDKPADTFESVYELKESGMYEPRERTEEEKVDWYLQIVLAGTITLEEVPEEYKAEVEAKLNAQGPGIMQTDEYMAGYDQAVLDMINDGIL